MASLIRVGQGNVSAKGILAKEDLDKFFKFCKRFDIIDGDKNDPYIFDVRSGVIHWLAKADKSICSSLYFDLQKGKISIELSDPPVWDHDAAIQNWNNVINQALKQ
jgi:hypothetical protein